MQSTLIKLISSLLLMLLVQNLWAYVPSGGSVYGSVYTRGVVLDANGDATYVAYGDDGKELEFIAKVNSAEMRNAQVMATAQANAVVDHFQTLRSEYPDIEVLTREAYSALSALPNAPTPESYINYVVVRGNAQRQLMVDGSQLVLQQSIIDPRGQYNGASLLVSKEGNVLASSEGNIGLRASFLRDENYEAVYDIGGSSYNYWRNNGYSLVHPLKGLRVTTWGSTGRNLGSGDTTNEEGRYSIRYRMFCPGFQHEWTIPVNVELKYSRFNPRGKINATYFFNTYKYDYCSGLHASLENSFSLTGQMAYLNVMAIELFLATPIIHRDVPIDVIILNGAAGFDNRVSFSQGKTRYDDNKSSLIRTAQAAEDFDNDGTVDKVATGKFVTTTNDAGEEVKSFEIVPISESPELQAIWLSRHHDLNTLDVTKTLPSYTRLLDWSDDFNDRALLSEINKKDLQNTDIYLIRESDGTLITERRGVKDAEAGIVGNLSTWDGEIKYTMQIVNRYETRNGYGYLRRRGWEKWQVAGNMNPKFYTRDADHLRIGEFVKIVAINRATGYMGSIRTEVKSAGSGTNSAQQLSFDIERIKMRPPNLKIWAKRTSEVGTNRGEEGIQQIGNEGAGLSDDKTIVISSEWLDHDGSPLPAALDDFGFTGRLARVVGEHNLLTKKGLAGGRNSLSNFAIKPGRQTQVIRLAEGDLGTEHLYVHVSGEPQKRRPDLSSGLTEGFSGNFNPDPGKYSENSILKHRPSLFVPVKVAVFDENSTKQSIKQWKEAKRNNPSLEKPEPTYRWVYRPEFQFSVYDLEINEIIRTPDQGEDVDIYISDDPAISASDDTLKILFDLTESTYNGLSNVLDAYSYYGDRELVFDLAGQELIATIGKDKTITFDNLDYLAALQSEDLLTIRLFSNNDAANVLWEYDFTPIQINIAADFNRNGEIEFPDNSKTEDEKLNDEDGKRTDYVTDDKPYVFWVNDDNDNKNSEIKGEDITIADGLFSTPDANNTFIDGSRDLIDFFAVAIDIHDILNRDGENYTYAFRHKDNGLNIAYTAMDINHADAYLTELKMDDLKPIFGEVQQTDKLHHIPLKRVEADKNATIIPEWFTNLIKEDENKGVILVEVVKATTEPLELVVFKGSEEVFVKELPLRAVNVKQLYIDVSLRVIESEKTSSLWTYTGDAPTSTSDINSVINTWNGKKENVLEVVNDTFDSNKNFIFIHGFHTDASGGVEFNNEIYKRLYHSGSNALYTGILWEGNDGTGSISSGLSYWLNNRNAFFTADNVTDFLKNDNMTGTKTVAAHSMGNVVMGSAISDFGLTVDNYFMIDPAVALEAYDGSQLNPAEMRHTDWDEYYYGAESPANYESPNGRRLWSTEWYSLFPDDDHRYELTWRDRFSKVINSSSINTVQYYSSGEDVLQQATVGIPNSFGPLNPFAEGSRNAWNISEKAKGNRQAAGTLFNGDSSAGWAFRDQGITGQQASQINPSKGRRGGNGNPDYFPFFKLFSINDAIIEETPSKTGSQNALEHRAHILSYDIPSLSFAAGGTEISDTAKLKGNKVDMDSAYKRVDGWPRNNQHWFHTDFKEVAYLYTSGLFKNMVFRGNLE